MDVLKPWLAVTIKGELSEALRHGENDTARHQSTGVSQGQSYDDGSNLRIPSAKKGPVVQITKFLTFEEPIQVTLSDSVTRVNASITNQASQQYAKQNKKKLTEGTIGGLIQLQEFEIVATHFGPRDKRLTLYVKDFKSIGSNGSGQFGFAPQAIESREVAKELLQKLEDLRKCGWDVHSEQSTTASPIKSQPSTQTSEAGVNEESQAGFATQIPRSNVSSVTKAKLQSMLATKSAKSLAPPTKGRHGTPLASISNPLQVQAAPPKPSTSEVLLGLLRTSKSAAPATEVVSEAKAKQTPRRPQASTERTLLERAGKPSQDITLTLGDENANRAPTEIPKRKRQSPLNIPRKQPANSHSLDRIEKVCVKLAANHDLDNKATSEAAVTKASINTLPNRPFSSSISGSIKIHPKSPPVASIDSDPKLTRSAPGQNTGRKRISSRDVNIPKDQEALLNRADSWLPAEPGQREPTANIPISVLRTLNQKADLRAQRATSIQKQRNREITSRAVTEQTADSESDIPVSSGQWPASPERDQLPPDSNSASAENSDHSVQISSEHPVSMSSRRQSFRSISPHSNSSGQPVPISTRHDLKQSRSPSMKSSGISSRRQSLRSSPSHSVSSGQPVRKSARYGFRQPGSPSMESSGISTPGVESSLDDEDVNRFICRTSGCDKSYKTSSGLKQHMNRHHSSTGFSEKLKCYVRDCTKSYASPVDLKYHIQCHHNGEKASPNHSGGATPVASGASTPMFPGLISLNERDRGLVKKVIDSGAHNELDGVEVSTSTPPLLYPGSRTSKGKKIPRQDSSINSALRSSWPPDAQPGLLESAISDLNENHVANGTSSPLLPASPTPESDLEMRVPFALNEKSGSIASSVTIQRFPSTASQSQDPLTQVKRTPYYNSGVHNQSIPGTKFLSSPSKANFCSLTNGSVDDNIEFVSASVPSGPDTSVAETRGENGSSGTVEERPVGSVAASVVEKPNSQNVTVSLPEKNNELIATAQHELRTAEAAASRPDDSSAEAKSRSVLEKLPARKHICTDPFSVSDRADQIAHEMKRKFAESSLDSPSVSKRHKGFKIQPGFTLPEGSEASRDPKEGARRLREDFLATRRTSESSTPTMSPHNPFSVFLGTKSENSRDPSERARQIRQGSFASRISNETSTPAMSPGLQHTRLPKVLQAEQRNLEVHITVDKEMMQVSSVAATETMHIEHAPAKDDGPLELVGTEHTPKSASLPRIMQKPSESQVALNLNAECVHSKTIRDDEPQVEPSKAKLALKNAISTSIEQGPSDSRIVIDLTEDDLPKTTKEKQISHESNVPHLINAKPPPWQYREDSSGRYVKIPYTTPAMRNSHVPLPPQSTRSPIVSATDSTKCTAKSNGRSLPWVEPGLVILHNSPPASASDSPERFHNSVESSSMSTTSPFSLLHTNGAVGKQNEDTPSKWWDDDNSPFKKFATAYASIHPGSNNSFAEANSGQPGDARKVEEGATTVAQTKVDITSWKL